MLLCYNYVYGGVKWMGDELVSKNWRENIPLYDMEYSIRD
jgi:hypothetical protein